MTSRATALIAFALLGAACRSRSCGEAPPAPKTLAAADGADADIDPAAAGQTERVVRAFPHGVASENAHAEIGDAPAPPAFAAPDPGSALVATIELRPDAGSQAALAAAVGPDDEAKGPHAARRIRGHDPASDRWMNVTTAPATTVFDRVAFVVDLVDESKRPRRARTAAELETHAAFARGVATSVGKGAPSFSATPAEAEKKATAAAATLDSFGDVDAMYVTLVVTPAAGKRFPGKAAWDAVYSAGFVWGEGDYFHWVPTPETDASQGIVVSTQRGKGRFSPEMLEQSEAASSLDELRFTFDVALAWKPVQVFDVMAHAATYVARRLDGSVRDTDAKPADLAVMRRRVAALEASLTSHGLVPGSGLALHLY